MRPEIESYARDIFPAGCFCPDARLPPDFYILHCPDHWFAKYALVQDCGEYAVHICNHFFFESAVQHANRRYKQGLIG